MYYEVIIIIRSYSAVNYTTQCQQHIPNIIIIIPSYKTYLYDNLTYYLKGAAEGYFLWRRMSWSSQ